MNVWTKCHDNPSSSCWPTSNNQQADTNIHNIVICASVQLHVVRPD